MTTLVVAVCDYPDSEDQARQQGWHIQHSNSLPSTQQAACPATCCSTAPLTQSSSCCPACPACALYSAVPDATTGNIFTVTCKKDAWASGSFSLLVNASTGNGDCNDFKTDTVHVEAYPVPNITLTADSSVAVCTESLSFIVNYTVTADPGRNLPYKLAYPEMCSISIPANLEASATVTGNKKECNSKSWERGSSALCCATGLVPMLQQDLH